MFDDDRIAELFSALSPHRRATAATLAARRTATVADLPGADAYFDAYAPGYAQLVADASELLADLAIAPAVDTARAGLMRERLETLLGAEGEEEEEPSAIVPALLFTAASIQNLALRAWTEPNRSEHWTLSVLSENYAFAYQLDQSKRQKPGGPAAEQAETTRQLAELEALAALGEPLSAADFAALEEQSRETRTLIQAKIRTIAGAVQTSPQRHLYAAGYLAPVRVMMYRDALSTKGLPARTLLFTASEPDGDGPRTIDGHRLLAIGTGGTGSRPGRYSIDCDNGWIYFLDEAAGPRPTRVAGMPSAFADILEAFDRTLADTTAADGPAAADQLLASVHKIDPTVARIDPTFWDSVAAAVASGAYAQR